MTSIPEGYALVPIEPTDEMTSAGGSGLLFATDETHDLAAKVYRAMIASAPPVIRETARPLKTLTDADVAWPECP